MFAGAASSAEMGGRGMLSSELHLRTFGLFSSKGKRSYPYIVEDLTQGPSTISLIAKVCPCWALKFVTS